MTNEEFKGFVALALIALGVLLILRGAHRGQE